jgi:hypothetical protein
MLALNGQRRVGGGMRLPRKRIPSGLLALAVGVAGGAFVVVEQAGGREPDRLRLSPCSRTGASRRRSPAASLSFMAISGNVLLSAFLLLPGCAVLHEDRRTRPAST